MGFRGATSARLVAFGGCTVPAAGGESAKNLNRPGLQRLLTWVESGKVEVVIIAKLDRLTRSVKDLCSLLELFEKRGVGLVSVAESLDTASAAGRLVITIMAAVSQWEREAIWERTLTPCGTSAALGSGWAISGSDSVSARTASTSNQILSKACSRKSVSCARAATRCGGLRPPSTGKRCGRAVVPPGDWKTWRESSGRQPRPADKKGWRGHLHFWQSEIWSAFPRIIRSALPVLCWESGASKLPVSENEHSGSRARRVMLVSKWPTSSVQFRA